MKDTQDNPRRMLRLTEVAYLTGLSRSTLYDRIALGEFPQPVNLGPKSVAWRCGDIYQWLDTRPVCGRLGARNEC